MLRDANAQTTPSFRRRFDRRDCNRTAEEVWPIRESHPATHEVAVAVTSSTLDSMLAQFGRR